jgi:hypothetical protein
MDMGGEVAEGEAELDSDVRVVKARERFESRAETFGSTAVDRHLANVGGDPALRASWKADCQWHRHAQICTSL